MNRRTARALCLPLLLTLATLALAQDDDRSRASRPGQKSSGSAFNAAEMPSLEDLTSPEPAPRPAVRRLNRVDCSVIDWQSQAEVPVLRLLCPSEKMFAPLRLILRVTWSSRDKMPKEAAAIAANPRAQAQMMFSEADREWRVRLDVKGENGKAQRRWITFDDVAGMKIISEQ